MTANAARPRRRGLTPTTAGCLLAAGCLALAALTLLAPSSPSYDPFAWIVWGRELMPGAGGEPFVLAGGPSWKPLPVFFTAPFALAGEAAPALWLVVARAGLLLALAGAFALARRFGGTLGGVVAALALLLLADVVSLAWRGASEPLLLAAVLWAGERHVAGARRTAFVLGVAAALIRPEAALFVALYALWLWGGENGRGRLLLAAGVLLVPLLWIGLPGLAGDPLAASTTARDPSTRTSAPDALGGDFGLALAAVWLLAPAAVVLRPREPFARALALGGTAWLVLLAVMAASGYASPARYAMPAAACACVLAGVAVAALATRARGGVGWAALALVATAALLIPAANRLAELDDQVREGVAVARSNEELRAAVEAVGAERLRHCALQGWVAVNHTAQTALAWELRSTLDRVAVTMRRPGLLVRAPHSETTGRPPVVALEPPLRRRPVARAGAWSIVTVSALGAPVPTACDGRKASEARRRIPNI
jgi:hypothetical protein